MKTTTKTMLAVLCAGVTAFAINLHAQDAGGPPQGRPGGQGGPAGQGGQGGPGMGHRMPPPSPLMEALDANHDGVIDADEIANASAALKKLDKNGDGKLTPDEIRPQRPQGMRGQGGPGGPDQQGQGRGPGQGHGPGQGQQGGQMPPPDGQLPPPDGAPQQ